MKYFFILILLLLPFMKQAQINTTLATELQSVVDNSVNNNGNNGVSAYLIMPDGTTWYGTAGQGKDNLAMTDTTLFHGASTTKMNVAVLTMLLAEENLIDLDASWTDYVSLNANFDTAITVRQLLNHTSGIRDYLEAAGSGSNVTADFNNFFTPQYILENIVNDSPQFPVGTSFQYSNSNYVLAGMIIEAVTGNSVHTELRNRIWNPLGMEHTYFGGYESFTEPSAGVWWNFGNGVTNYNNEATTSMLSYAYCAGNIVSCPQDLAKFLDAIINDEFLTSTSMTELLTFVPASFSSWTNGYGLGTHHATGQTNVIGHDGYYTNMTDMFHDMDYGFTLVTMTNTQTTWFGIFNPMHAVLENYFLNTDVEDLQEEEKEWNIFPNPSNGIVEITNDDLIEEVIITDALGKEIIHVFPKETSISLELDVAGLYLVSVKVKEKVSTRKLLVN